MRDSNIEHVPCPYCKYSVEINVRFAISNGRVFCQTCCKSFDIRIEEDEKEEIPVVESPKEVLKEEPIAETPKEEPVKEGKEDKLDKDYYNYWA